MCGRYIYIDSHGVMRVIYGFTRKTNLRAVSVPPKIRPRYNAAIGQGHPIIMNNGEAALAKWGLVPSRSHEPAVPFDTFNAKAETLTEKKTFAPILRYRRCLVPADGTIEFRKQGKTKTPFLIRLKSRAVFCFAGLWDLWHDELLSYTIITTPPNDIVAPFHYRMAAILHEKDYTRWLNEPDLSLLKSYPAEEMEALELNPLANSVTNDSEEILTPPAPPPPPIQPSLF